MLQGDKDPMPAGADVYSNGDATASQTRVQTDNNPVKSKKRMRESTTKSNVNKSSKKHMRAHANVDHVDMLKRSVNGLYIRVDDTDRYSGSSPPPSPLTQIIHVY